MVRVYTTCPDGDEEEEHILEISPSPKSEMIDVDPLVENIVNIQTSTEDIDETTTIRLEAVNVDNMDLWRKYGIFCF